jgi:hypothetical protein
LSSNPGPTKKKKKASVILATREAEIRRIRVQNQSRQIVLKALPQKLPSQKKRAGGVA